MEPKRRIFAYMRLRPAEFAAALRGLDKQVEVGVFTSLFVAMATGDRYPKYDDFEGMKARLLALIATEEYQNRRKGVPRILKTVAEFQANSFSSFEITPTTPYCRKLFSCFTEF